MMKKYLFMLWLNVLMYPAFSQYTIELCQQKAKENYPLVRQYDLIQQSEHYSMANANRGYLPQLTATARATYQSEVIELPMNIPGFKPLNKDQYQAVAEVTQALWDGGLIKSQKEISKASAEVERQKYEVDMYALKDRVNQLFFGILLITDQLVQTDLLMSELQTNYNRISAYVASGLANQSDKDAIKVEQLKTKQRRAELVAIKKSYMEMLGSMIGDSLGMSASFVKPMVSSTYNAVLENNRPELKLFDAQRNMFASQASAYKSTCTPKLSLFFQGAYGNPGLNMLKEGFTPYYITGARLSWNFSNLYTLRNNLRKIEINQQSIDIQKEVFLYNSKLKISQQQNEIEKLKTQISDDDEIISLRNSIKKTAEVKVQNGTLSVSDLIRDINAENLAIQQKSLHEVQLMIAIYNLNNTTNNE